MWYSCKTKSYHFVLVSIKDVAAIKRYFQLKKSTFCEHCINILFVVYRHTQLHDVQFSLFKMSEVSMSRCIHVTGWGQPWLFCAFFLINWLIRLSDASFETTFYESKAISFRDSSYRHQSSVYTYPFMHSRGWFPLFSFMGVVHMSVWLIFGWDQKLTSITWTVSAKYHCL